VTRANTRTKKRNPGVLLDRFVFGEWRSMNNLMQSFSDSGFAKDFVCTICAPLRHDASPQRLLRAKFLRTKLRQVRTNL
jgi:hypothetical protein